MEILKNRAFGALSRTLLGAIAWALLLAALDTRIVWMLGRGYLDPSTLITFFVLCAGSILLVVLPPLATRAALLFTLPTSFWTRAFVGGLSGTFVAYLACYRQDYETIGDGMRVLLAAALVIAGALSHAIFSRSPTRLRFLLPLLSAGALVISAGLPVRELPFAHLALMVLAAVSWVSTFELAAPLPQQGQTTRNVFALLIVLVLSTFVWIGRRDPVVRSVLHRKSYYGRIHTELVPFLFRRDAIKNIERCANTYDECNGPTRSQDPKASLHASARGADVLMISIDALRWDHVDALAPLLQEIGPHVRFERAFSPSPRTVHSFAAMLRGRPLRQVSHGFVAKNRMSPDAEPTIGSVVSQQGMRAVNVPGHPFLAVREGISAGFEEVLPERLRPSLGQQRMIPAGKVNELLLAVARETEEPLLAWSHAMEGHAPYRWHGGAGPNSPEGQRHAFADLADDLVERVRAFRKAREGRKLVIVLFADHGEEFGEHGGQYHASTVHAEQVRVAFVLAAPGLSPRRVTAPVSTTAIGATLFDLLGIERPCSFTVPSLLACAEGQDACPTLAVSEVGYVRNAKVFEAAYTDHSHRLIYDYRENLKSLFSLRADPYERRDLVYRSDAQAPLLEITKAAAAFDEVYCRPQK